MNAAPLSPPVRAALPQPSAHTEPVPQPVTEPGTESTEPGTEGTEPVTDPVIKPSAGSSTEESGCPCRLVLSPRPGVEECDGVWWPRTTELQLELPQLDVALHHLIGARIARLSQERGLWDDAPRNVRTPLGITHIGWFRRGRRPDHVILSLSNDQRLRLTVLPSGTNQDDASAILESTRA